MTASRRRFTQEFKDELCQEVISTSKPIKEVAVAYGVGRETLRNWLIKYRDANGGTETELTASDPDPRVGTFWWGCVKAGKCPLSWGNGS